MNDPAAVVEQVWRAESSRLLGALLRVTRDVGRAEDLAQQALAEALTHWPRTGVPDNPAAWLMTTAKRRAIDQFRAGARQVRAYARVSATAAEAYEQSFTFDHVDDDVLRLMFVCCHPSLTDDTRTVLTLRLVAGLTTREIARAYLTSEATVATRVSRAKRTLAEAGAALEEPTAAERTERLGSVLAVVYLLFNEGYAATAGIDWTRPALCTEAIRVARLLVAVAADAPEAHGLLALLELQSSRLGARIDPSGEAVLLADQDRRTWDHAAIERGLAALAVAERHGNGGDGAYVLQARIAAEHARAASVAGTDWVRIAGFYEQLAQATGSLVVELNRAVALGMAYGPETGLALADLVGERPGMADYHPLHAVRGDLLQRLGRGPEAATAFRRAAALAGNDRERALLARRADAAAHPAGPDMGVATPGWQNGGMLLTEIDHVAIAVNDLEAAIDYYQRAFGATVDHREVVESDGVEEALLKVAESYIQLLTPTREDSPVAKALAKRGEGLHHIGYRVDDCAQALAAMVAAGATPLDAAPRPGSRGTTVAFVHPKSSFGTLIELVQE